jgi:5-methyltetrahydropteroyltriglutamate--homocysteine methyltransferase
MPYPTHLLPTTVVGSYPQPDWLIDRGALEKHGVPRVHAHEIWRVAPERLKEAQDDATILAIGEMEKIGIDIVSDGEMRRESYSNYFSLALDGIDAEQVGSVIGANRRATPVARVVAKIRRKGPVEIDDAAFLVKHAPRATKITLPGPFTMSQQVQNEFYKDEAELAMDYADAVNAELKELKATGVDVVQLDEPWVRAAPDKAAEYGIAAINRALQGIDGPTVVHICLGYGHLVHNKPSGYAFLPQLAEALASQVSLEAAQPRLDLGVLKELSSKTILLGVLDLGSAEVETADQVAGRLRAGLQHVAPERLVAAPDCGMKYLPRARAAAKLRAMVEGAAIVRRELTG